MKKVLFVATVVKSHIMVFHIPYLKWFKNNGYEVHVCSTNDYETKEDCSIPHCDKFYDMGCTLSPFSFQNIKAYKKLKETIDENDYEIIHCHTPVGGLLGRIAAIKARRKGTKVFYTAHGFHFHSGAPIKNWLIYYPVEKFLSRFTDVLVTINQEDYKLAKNKLKAGKIKNICGIGIDEKKILAVTADAKTIRKELEVLEDAFVVLSVGTLKTNKNHATIIKALKKIDNPDIHYLICGDGSEEEDLRNLIDELNLNENVKLIGYRNDILEIMKSVDLYAFPSFREGMPVSLMEAMLCGLPAVCSDVRGNNELIDELKNGYLLKPDDVEGFANYIDSEYKNSKLVKDLVEYNKKKLQPYFLENVIKDMTEIYRS